MGDEKPRDAPPLHIGNHPHGSYWSADREDAKKRDDHPARPPWVTTVPRSPANPNPLRMFAETGCDFALWGPLGEPPPTTNGAQNATTLEEQLPISVSLRDRLLKWSRDYESDSGEADDFDERGYHLSRELAHELGELYSVTFALTYSGQQQAVLHARARSEPHPNWRLTD